MARVEKFKTKALENKKRLKQMKIENARNKQVLADIVKNKDVVIVGPAGYLVGQQNGSLIDSFDIVVRVNDAIRIMDKNYIDFGERIDILYHNLASFSKICEDYNRYIQKETKSIVCKTNLSSSRVENFFKQTACSIPIIAGQQIYSEISKNIRKAPNMGVVAIVHLLSFDIKSLSVFGFDFYKTGYAEEYYIKNFTGSHDWDSQILYLSQNVLNDKRFLPDDILLNILENADNIDSDKKRKRNKHTSSLKHTSNLKHITNINKWFKKN